MFREKAKYEESTRFRLSELINLGSVLFQLQIKMFCTNLCCKDGDSQDHSNYEKIEISEMSIILCGDLKF